MKKIFIIFTTLILMVMTNYTVAEPIQEHYTKVYLEANRIITTDTSIEYVNHSSTKIPLTFLGVDANGIFTFTNTPEQFLWIMCPRCNREHFLGYCPVTDGL